MGTRRFTIASWCMAVVLGLNLNSWTQSIGQEKQDEITSNLKKDGALETVEFDTLEGKVEVNLPEDMSATDTISGTVLVEPKGDSKEEVAQNEDTLRGYVVEIENTVEVPDPPKCPPTSKPPKSQPPKSPPKIPPTCPPGKGTTSRNGGTCPGKPPVIFVVPGSRGGFTTGIPGDCGNVNVVVRNGTGRIICSLPVPTRPKPPKRPPGCTFPPTCTAGGPMVINCPGDGRSCTTNVTCNGRTCAPIAESPRVTITQPPKDLRGPCTVAITECGRTNRGRVTMLPPPTCQPAKPKPQPPAAKPEQYVFRRTGPFVSQEQPSCYVNQDNTVSVDNNHITWSGPKYIKGDPIVSSTVQFDAPPELIRVGDHISLNASISGARETSTQGAYLSGGGWFVETKRSAPSVSLAEGCGQPNFTEYFEIRDYKKMIKETLIAHPEYASKVTPEVMNRLPSIKFFCPGRFNVTVEWKYVPAQ